MSDRIILPAAEKISSRTGNTSPPVGVSLTPDASRGTGETGRSQAPVNKKEVHDMTNLRTALLATTAVGLMALATSAFAEVIMTPDGHYYKLVPLKAPPPGAESGVIMAIPQGATASVAPAPASNCRLTSFVSLEYQPEYTTVCGPE
jgi:hypothetical protein